MTLQQTQLDGLRVIGRGVHSVVSRRRRVSPRTVLWLLAMVGAPALVLNAQEPVDKPATAPPVTRAGDRLPPPTTVRAWQRPDGRIEVRWSSVPDATSYALIRSVPPGGQLPIGGTITDTTFIDSDVQAGKTYYYLVSGLNQSVTGLRKGASPVSATRDAGTLGDLFPPNIVLARYELDRKQVRIIWRPVRRAPSYLVEVRDVSTTEWRMVARQSDTVALISDMPERSRVQFRVMSEDASLNKSSPSLTPEIVIPVAPPGSGSPVSAPAPGGVAGTVAVSMGAVAVRVGATTPAASAVAGFSPTRWVSLDEPIATVDAAGAVTGRSAGRASVLAIGRGTDGSVRVTLVQVTVTP